MNTSYLTPMVIHKEANGERAMDIYSSLFRDRIIWVAGEVEPMMANAIKAQLIKLEAEDPEADITMYIDSPGGVVSTGMGIYDVMQYINCDVRTICVGLAASMGSVLLMGGTKGKRYAMKNSEIMIHQPSAGCQGKISDMQRSYEHSLHIKENLTDIYVKHTNLDRTAAEQALDRDSWMTPEEAVECGLIDQVITDRKEVIA